MTTMQRDPLVDDYLRRLEAAAADLPRERRRELVGEIEAHVDDALAADGGDEAGVRNALERLGAPEEIAAAAGPPPAPRARRGPLETIALIVLCVSFLLPVAGYLIGAGFVLASKAWSGREKAIGLLVPPLAVLAGLIVVLVGVGLLSGEAAGSDDAFVVDVGPVEFAVLSLSTLSGFIAAGYLASRLTRAG